MAGENLTPMQRAFLQKHLKLTIFSGKRDKRVTQAYEAYLVVEGQYQTARTGLPTGDPRVQNLLQQGVPAFKKRDEGDFAEATNILTPLVGQLGALTQTLQQEIAQAAQRYQTAIQPLPQDDGPTQAIANRVAPFLNATLAGIPVAITALDQATQQAGQRLIQLPLEHAQAVQRYQTAIAGLPPDDGPTAQLIGQTSGSLNVPVAGMPAAIRQLAQAEAAAGQRVTQLELDHATAAQSYRTAIGRLPPDDGPSQTLISQTAPFFNVAVTMMPAAIQQLARAEAAAGQRLTQLALDHAAAVQSYQSAIGKLPPDDGPTKTLISQTAPFLNVAALMMPAAILQQAQAEATAGQRATEISLDHASAVHSYQTAIGKLPPDDGPTVSLVNQASPFLNVAVAAMPAAIEQLKRIEAAAGERVQQLTLDHAAAVLSYQTAIGKLPPDDGPTKTLISQTAPFLNVAVTMMPAAILQLVQAEAAADLRPTEIELEHAAAVQSYETAIAKLPPGDGPSSTLISQTAACLTVGLMGMPAAILQLGEAAAAAGQREIAISQEYALAVQAYNSALASLPPADSRVTGITGRAVPHLGLTAALAMPAAMTALGLLKSECEALKQTIANLKNTMAQKLSSLADPTAATVEQKKKMKTHRDAATLALADTYPSSDQTDAAKAAIEALRKLIATATQIGKLPTATAALANQALEWFDQTAGPDEVTQERLAQVLQARADAETALGGAYNEMAQAQNLPSGTPEEQRIRNEAIRLAQDKIDQSGGNLRDATDIARAVAGKKFLTDALTTGVLAPDAGRPLSETAAQNAIRALTIEPETAQVGLDLMTRSKDPEALAASLQAVCGNVAGGFADQTGRTFPTWDYCLSYGSCLLKQGDLLGGQYFAEMQAYIDSGEQFEASVIGDGWGKSEREQTGMRSEAAARALLGSDGSFAPDQGQIDKVIGQLKYSPEAVMLPTPLLTQHVVHSFEQLQQGTNTADMALLMNGATAPTGKPGTDLVRSSLGKADTDSIDDGDTRAAILKSFFTPVDQGPVGSCFTTAPARRFREEDPVGALRGMTEVATTGKFTSATNVKVPASSKVPQGENPILRSWEYAVASASGSAAGSAERTRLGNEMKSNPGIAKVASLVPGDPQARNKIELEVQSAFTFQYNPMKQVTDANDGSSSTGRYQIIETDDFGAPTGAPVETEDQFVEVMTRRLLKKLNVDPTSTEGTEIAEAIKTDMLVTVTPKDTTKPPYKAVSPNGYKPWELASGGWGLGPSKALYGGAVQTTPTLTPAPTTPKPAEGERSKDVLMNVLTEAQKDPTAKYQTIDSRGCHEYNALPGEPSLQALFGSDPADTENKVDAFIQQGVDIIGKDISHDRALKHFDKQVSEYRYTSTDPVAQKAIEDAIDQNRPTGPMTPAELKRRIKAALKASLDQNATDRGGTAKEIEDRKKGFEKYAERAAMTDVAYDIGLPQVIWADTNWGDGSNHIYFVMMGDPETGELKMWKRTDPPGSLELTERKDWVDKGMHLTK